MNGKILERNAWPPQIAYHIVYENPISRRRYPRTQPLPSQDRCSRPHHVLQRYSHPRSQECLEVGVAGPSRRLEATCSPTCARYAKDNVRSTFSMMSRTTHARRALHPGRSPQKETITAKPKVHRQPLTPANSPTKHVFPPKKKRGGK